LNPRLNDLFYWHFHPEYELVYIENADGTRHVGEHISPFYGSDLVLIGSNIPHLNFDYGVKTACEKVVLQIHPDFKTGILQKLPELEDIHLLFEKAQRGIAFHGQTKEAIGQRLLYFQHLSPFAQFLEALQLFQQLAQSQEFTLLHEQPYVNQYSQKEQERIRQIYAYIDQHYQRKITIQEVAQLCNLGREAFCRYFKRATGSTFIELLNQYRISQAKRLLLLNKNVSETCFECGFESLSYFNRIFKKVTDENPSDFRKRHYNRQLQN
ncbi:MAG: AraC family transcriptional regulator, partial [Bacteroidota bacterium]